MYRVQIKLLLLLLLLLLVSDVAVTIVHHSAKVSTVSSINVLRFRSLPTSCVFHSNGQVTFTLFIFRFLSYLSQKINMFNIVCLITVLSS